MWLLNLHEISEMQSSLRERVFAVGRRASDQMNRNLSGSHPSLNQALTSASEQNAASRVSVLSWLIHYYSAFSASKGM